MPDNFDTRRRFDCPPCNCNRRDDRRDDRRRY